MMDDKKLIKRNTTSVNDYSLSTSQWWGVILSVPYAIFSAVIIFISIMSGIGFHSELALTLYGGSILLGSGISCILPFIIYYMYKKRLDSLLIWLIVFSPWVILMLGFAIALIIDSW